MFLYYDFVTHFTFQRMFANVLYLQYKKQYIYHLITQYIHLHVMFNDTL